MAGRKKAPTTIIKELEKDIEKLKSDLKYTETSRDNYRKSLDDAQRELNGIHAVMDTLEVPRKVKKEYSGEIDMDISARLFAWQAGAKLKPVNTVE